MNTIDKIIEDYENLRKNADDERKKRISEVYKNHPELKKTDDEIRQCGINCMNKIIADPACSDDVNLFIKHEMEKLKKKRMDYIIKNNIDFEFDKNKYVCRECKDTGFIENKKCKCFIQKIIDEEFNNSNMGERQRNQTFDKFNNSYYSKEESENGITNFERINKIYDVSKKFAEDFDNVRKSLLFYGSPGTGKTFMSSCIANELMKKGKTVLYARAGRLFDLFERNHFGKGDIEKDNEMIERVYSCDLLIIDDLGTEFKSRNTASFLYDFFDERISNDKKLIINTNYNMKELEEMYTLRFTSRVNENFNILKFVGKDIRTLI